jgi:hypothetical protein
MFKDLYPATWRAAVAHMEARKKAEAVPGGGLPANDKPAPPSPSPAHSGPLRLTIDIPVDGPVEIAVRLVRSGSTWTAAVVLGCASDGLIAKEVAP